MRGGISSPRKSERDREKEPGRCEGRNSRRGLPRVHTLLALFFPSPSPRRGARFYYNVPTTITPGREMSFKASLTLVLLLDYSHQFLPLVCLQPRPRPTPRTVILQLCILFHRAHSYALAHRLPLKAIPIKSRGAGSSVISPLSHFFIRDTHFFICRKLEPTSDLFQFYFEASGSFCREKGRITFLAAATKSELSEIVHAICQSTSDSTWIVSIIVAYPRVNPIVG